MLIFPSNVDAYNAYIKETDQPTNPTKRLILAVKTKATVDGATNISVPDSENAKMAEINSILNTIADDLIEKGKDVNPSLTSGDKALIIKAEQTNIPDNSVPSNNNVLTTSFAGIDITKYYISLYNYRNKQKISYDEAKAIYDQKTNEITQRVLGFYPTPNNIFRILCNDVDNIFQNLRKVGEDSEAHHEKYRNQIITSVNSDPNSKIPIGAFPFCFKLENATSTDNSQDSSNSFNRMVRAFPSDIDQFKQLPEPFPEVNFVNSFINATIDLAKAELVDSVKENTDVNGNTLWFPINPVDTTLKGEYSNESPFGQIERQKNYQLNKLYEIIINRFYIVSQYTSTELFEDESTYTQLVAESDSINLAKSFIDGTLLDLLRINAERHRNYNSFIEYISNPKNQVTNYDKVSIDNTFTKFDNTDVLFYRSRDNADFVGFDYADVDLEQRVATENSEDLVNKFLEEQTSTWTKVSNSVINFFGGDKIELQSFTKENMPYFPDIESGNNELDSKFFDEPYVGFIDFWKWYFADDLPALTNIFSGTTYSAFQRAWIMVSNMGRTRSFYHSKCANKFSLGSGVEMPNYANLYMGLLALAYHPAIPKPTPTFYSDQISQIINGLPVDRTGFFGKQNPIFLIEEIGLWTEIQSKIYQIKMHLNWLKNLPIILVTTEMVTIIVEHIIA
ncbi:MAG: hypothetical protein HC836_36355 [Richelia sp. RM2_1_2]|nr:hypothetical protein [Richelia sp. RM2_1_2]